MRSPISKVSQPGGSWAPTGGLLGSRPLKCAAPCALAHLGDSPLGASGTCQRLGESALAPTPHSGVYSGRGASTVRNLYSLTGNPGGGAVGSAKVWWGGGEGDDESLRMAWRVRWRREMWVEGWWWVGRL